MAQQRARFCHRDFNRPLNNEPPNHLRPHLHPADNNSHLFPMSISPFTMWQDSHESPPLFYPPIALVAPSNLNNRSPFSIKQSIWQYISGDNINPSALNRARDYCGCDDVQNARARAQNTNCRCDGHSSKIFAEPSFPFSTYYPSSSPLSLLRSNLHKLQKFHC